MKPPADGTEKLYRKDSWRLAFEASLQVLRHGERGPELVLDRTAFYPSGGGQPHDTGVLAERAVIDVYSEGEAVVHVLDGDPGAAAGATLSGRVDATRRLDHLQHHSGQHLLSQAFVREADAETSSFHLGRDRCSIDLDRELDPAAIERAESLVNQVIFEDREVRVHEVTPEELARFDVRKPGFEGASIRLVEVVGFDTTTCGGTHAHRTGQVGLLCVLGSERSRGGTRVHFVCGRRAHQVFRHEHAVVQELGRRLDVGPERVLERFDQLESDHRDARRSAARWFEQAVAARAAELCAEAPVVDGVRVVLLVDDSLDRGQLEKLARALVQTEGTVAALASRRQEPVRYVLARSDDLALRCGDWMKRWAESGAVRGGGAPALAQGVGLGEGDPRAALEAALSLRPWIEESS